MTSTEGFIKVINLTHYLLLSPFRLILKNSHGGNEPIVLIKKSLLQMCLCGALTFLDIIFMTHSIRSCILFDNANSPQRYFSLFGAVASQVGKCIMIRKLWMDSESFLVVANRTTGNCKACMSTKDKLWLCLVCFTGTTVGFANFFSISGESVESSGIFGYLYVWWSEMVVEGQKVYYIYANETSTLSKTPLEITAGILTALGCLQRLEPLIFLCIPWIWFHYYEVLIY